MNREKMQFMILMIFSFIICTVQSFQSTSEWNPLGKCIFFLHPARYLLSSSRFYLYIVGFFLQHFAFHSHLFFLALRLLFADFHVECMTVKNVGTIVRG